jgi:hypothetical protein
VLADDISLAYVFPGWLNQLQPYGPIWTSMAGLLSSLSVDSIPHTVTLFQCWGLLGCLLTLYGLHLLLLGQPEETYRTRMYLLAANPLLLADFCNNAHNDIWMLGFALLAFAAMERNRPELTMPLIICGALVKGAVVVLLPFAALELYRRNALSIKAASASALIGAMIVLCVFAPYYVGADTFAGLAQVTKIDSSYAAFIGTPALIAAYLWHYCGTTIVTANEAMILGRFLCSIALLLLFTRAEGALSSVLVLASSVFLPWYTAWLLPFSAVSGRAAICIAWTTIGLASYPMGYRTSYVFLAALPAVFLWIVFFRPANKQR